MTIGTLLYTWLNGSLVGTDEFGNRYYKGKKPGPHGRERRWVVYKGGGREASAVPPEWHAWLHHTVADPLTANAAETLDWQKQHVPNLTGTAGAYRPQGHEYKGGKRAQATGDYEAWTPE